MKLKSYQRIVELNLDGTKRKYVKTPAFGRPGFFEVFPYIEENREEAKNGTSTKEPPEKLKRAYRRSAKIMNWAQRQKEEYSRYEEPSDWDNLDKYNNSLPQSTYLMSRKNQDALLRHAGYFPAPGDFGLVKKAVGNRNLPVYQTRPDAAKREDLVHLGNVMENADDRNLVFQDDRVELRDPGFYPVSLYVDSKTGTPYAKGWDLNDYYPTNPKDYPLSKRVGARILDFIGNPTVYTTGYQPLYNTPSAIEDAMRKKGLLTTESYDWEWTPESGIPMWSLPPVEITAERNKKKRGGSIDEPPEKKNPDLTPLDLATMYENNASFGGDKYLDTNLVRAVDNQLIKRGMGLPQRMAVASSIHQEGSTLGDHKNGAFGLVGYRGNRAKNLPSTAEGQADKIYDETFGKFNGDNWHYGGEVSGYKRAREAQQAFINARTPEEAMHALTYGYVRPPQEARQKRVSNITPLFTNKKKKTNK